MGVSASVDAHVDTLLYTATCHPNLPVIIGSSQKTSDLVLREEQKKRDLFGKIKCPPIDLAK